jgi:hypothetical protein
MVPSSLTVQAHSRFSSSAQVRTVARNPRSLFVPSLLPCFIASSFSARPVALLALALSESPEGALAVHFPFPPKPFRINTYKSVTKQTSLTSFRINTYEKHRGEGVLLLTSTAVRLHVAGRPHGKALDSLFQLLTSNVEPLTCGIIPPRRRNVRIRIPAMGRIQ